MNRNDLYKLLIFKANEGENKPINGTYELIKELWFFLESDTATKEGKEIAKICRYFSLYTKNHNTGKVELSLFDHDYTFCGTRNKIKLVESDFQNDFIKWIDRQLSFEGLKSEHERKYNEFKSYIETLLEQPEKKQKEPSFIVVEYALTYIFDLYSSGQQIPLNRTDQTLDKKEIERQSSFYNCPKKQDTFYREVMKIVKKYDINKKIDLQNLSNDWSNAVLTLSKDRNKLEQYLKEKKLI